MPVTVRYSAALDRTYEDGELPASPVGSSSSGSSTPASLGTAAASSSSSPSPLLQGAGDDFGSPLAGRRADSVDSLDVESLGSGSGNHSRQVSADSTEFIPTRTIKTNAKPAFNPLQFVKTGKSRLVRTAEQQIKQFEEVKKVKERVREDEEAWQSNLDNWKSKRRQISHKTIQKAEEIKQMEEVELDRQRKKSKTFNEMMEERSKRGTQSALPSYDEWGNEESPGDHEEGGTSDESGGAATRGDVSFESTGSDHVFQEDKRAAKFAASTPVSKAAMGNGQQQDANGGSSRAPRKPTNGHLDDGSGASDEPEYTFDKAIQSYAQFAESRLRQPPSRDDRSVRSPAAEDSAARDASPKKPADEDDEQLEKIERASGRRLSIVVCLRRGGDSKEFGFGIKSVRGIGTGIFVENVHLHGPAESAGLMANDEILAINGEFCSSKRTHSAIVFAVKQAVYTGNLELEIYRYDDTDRIRASFSAVGSKSPTRIDHRSSSETVLQQQHPLPPKVDVMKRRSVFETSSRTSPEKAQNRRSLDVSSKIKDKLASFENGGEAASTDFRKSPRRIAAFQQKLASFRSLDSLSRGSGTEAAAAAASYEEDDAELERRGVQAFERTRSCECLDYDEAAAEESRGYADRQFETDLSELQMLVSMADEEDRAAAGSLPIDFETDEAAAGRAIQERRFEESAWTERAEEAVSLHRDESWSDGRSFAPKSGFELAESLEETPITGSAPGSPREADSSGEPSLGFGQDLAQIARDSPDADDLGSQLENLDLSGDVFVVDDVDPPSKTLEPPKEKPPPPPVEAPENGKKNQPDKAKRVDSTKRIRTEIWKRRTDFLGIDGEDVQKLMQHEIESVTPPPTLENLLREDLFGTSWKEGGTKAVAEDEDEDEDVDVDLKEIGREERESIENLEWEERLMEDNEADGGDEDFDANARHTEATAADEPSQEDFSEPPSEDVAQPSSFFPDTDVTLKIREAELQRQEELLRLEKEKLRQEQEELLRQKEAYQKRIEDHQRGGVGAASSPPVAAQAVVVSPKKDVRPPPASPIYETISPPALLSPEGRPARATAQPPPPPPTKPKMVSPVFNDRVRAGSDTADPSDGTDKWPVHPRISDDHRPKSDRQPALQPLTKQALSALSASPKVKLMDGDQWMARRKTNGQRRENYNQHWLVQEAEFRRLHPQQQQQQQDVEWQPQPPPQGGWKAPQANGNHAPSNGHGVYSPNDQPQRPPPNHRPHVPEGHYAVPQPHRQQQNLLPQERRQDAVVEVPPPAAKAAPPPHPPKPGGHGPKTNLAAAEPSASQMLSVSGKKKCSHCSEELGRGAAMIIESLQLFYHINCFKCCVCHIQLGNGTSGADVRVRSQKLHCHNCYSNDEGLKFSKV